MSILSAAHNAASTRKAQQLSLLKTNISRITTSGPLKARLPRISQSLERDSKKPPRKMQREAPKSVPSVHGEITSLVNPQYSTQSYVDTAATSVRVSQGRVGVQNAWRPPPPWAVSHMYGEAMMNPNPTTTSFAQRSWAISHAEAMSRLSSATPSSPQRPWRATSRNEGTTTLSPTSPSFAPGTSYTPGHHVTTTLYTVQGALMPVNTFTPVNPRSQLSPYSPVFQSSESLPPSRMLTRSMATDLQTNHLRPQLSPYSPVFQPSESLPPRQMLTRSIATDSQTPNQPKYKGKTGAVRRSPSRIPSSPSRFVGRSSPANHRSPIPEPTKGYLRQSQMGLQPCKAKPLLLVIDLNGTILFRPSKNSPKNFVERPFTNGFLKYALENHKVMIWSSAKEQNVAHMVGKLFPGDRRKRLVAEWNRDHLDLTAWEFNNKVQVYKRLETVWSNREIQATYPKSDDDLWKSMWDQSNTVLIDDTIEKARGQPHNLIELPEFTNQDTANDTVLAVLIDYLEILKKQDDVSCYIRQVPFDYESLKKKYSDPRYNNGDDEEGEEDFSEDGDEDSMVSRGNATPSRIPTNRGHESGTESLAGKLGHTSLHKNKDHSPASSSPYSPQYNSSNESWNNEDGGVRLSPTQMTEGRNPVSGDWKDIYGRDVRR